MYTKITNLNHPGVLHPFFYDKFQTEELNFHFLTNNLYVRKKVGQLEEERGKSHGAKWQK